MSDQTFDKIAIIGIGLIGSSLAHAVKAYGGAGQVSLYDADPDVRDLSVRLVPGETVESLKAAVMDADCVILCVPVGAFEKVMSECAEHFKRGAILTDVGSVKNQASEVMQHAPEYVHVVPGHPIAGTEKSGPAAGFASLFQDAWYILTPLENQGAGYSEAVAKLTSFWERLGSKVDTMNPRRHDRVLAITSHLPHLIAYNIVSTAYDMENVKDGEVVKYSAGGFRDFTRIAASDPIMWRDVFLANKEAVLETLGRFGEDLAALQRAIRWDDGDALIREFTRARGIRKAIIDAGLDTEKADFGRREEEPDSKK